MFGRVEIPTLLRLVELGPDWSANSRADHDGTLACLGHAEVSGVEDSPFDHVTEALGGDLECLVLARAEQLGDVLHDEHGRSRLLDRSEVVPPKPASLEA